MRVAPTTVISLCGLASVAAGLLWTIGTLTNLAAAGSIGPRTTAGTIIGLATHTTMVFAFVGIYAGQARSMGLVGVFGAVLGIIGATLVVGEIAVAFARAFGAVEVVRPPFAIGIPATLSLLVGVVLTGIATIRARVYHRWAGVPFVVSLVLLLLQLVDQRLAIVAIASASAGFVWLGWEVIANQRRPVSRPLDR